VPTPLASDGALGGNASVMAPKGGKVTAAAASTAEFGGSVTVSPGAWAGPSAPVPEGGAPPGESVDIELLSKQRGLCDTDSVAIIARRPQNASSGPRWRLTDEPGIEVISDERAKTIYGERYAEFLDNVKEFAYFPYAVATECGDFQNGQITMRFKTIAGVIDQGAGILFNLKVNGDYLALRANPLENNLVLWTFEKGKRSSVKWIKDADFIQGMARAEAGRGRQESERLHRRQTASGAHPGQRSFGPRGHLVEGGQRRVLR
jgi:hypothetical protein